MQACQLFEFDEAKEEVQRRHGEAAMQWCGDVDRIVCLCGGSCDCLNQ